MKILTKETSESVLRFQKYFLNQVWKKMIFMAWIPVIFAIICIILGSYFIGGFVIFFYVIMIIVFPFINKKTANDLNKSNKFMMESKICEYEINDESFISRVYQNDEMIAMAKYKYEQVFKVEESSSDIYIFIANNQAFCIDKNDIDEKDVNELRGILQSNVLNYKIAK